MQVLIENEDKLVMCWGSGCVWNGGSCYYSGPSGPGDEGSLASGKPIPYCLQFTIMFKNGGNTTLYNLVRSSLECFQGASLCSTIKITYPTPTYVNGPVVKDEYKKLVKCVEEQNKMTTIRYNSLVQQLEEIGTDTSCLPGPEYTKVPGECYEQGDARYTGISVFCHSGTDFYKSLESLGLLKKYAPKWY